MFFRELVLENFGSYVGRQTIDLMPIEKDGRLAPIVLLGGLNGGGKTTLVDALRLVLYGNRAQCSTRGSLSYADFLQQCISRQAPSDAVTRIELSFQAIEEGKLVNLRAIRYWDRNLKDGRDTLGILVDDEWPDRSLAKVWDEYIENLLPLGIANLFLFDGETVRELADLEEPPPSAIEAMRTWLGLELVERLGTDLETIATRKRREMMEDSDRQALGDMEGRLASQQEELATVEAAIIIREEEFARVSLQQQQALDKFVVQGGQIASEKQDLERQKERLQLELAQIDKQLCDLAGKSLPLALIQSLLVSASLQMEREEESDRAAVSLSMWEDFQIRFRDLVEGLPLTAEARSTIADFVDLEVSTIADRSRDVNAYIGGDRQEKILLDRTLNYTLPDEREKGENLLDKREETYRELTNLSKQLDNTASPEAYDLLQKQLQVAQSNTVRVKVELETSRRQRQDIEREISKIKKELTAYTEANLSYTNATHLIATISKVRDTLQIFKIKLTQKKISQLETEILECFSYLLRKQNLITAISISPDTFKLNLYDDDRQLIPNHRLSAGEKQLLAIAFLWGLARVSRRQIPLTIDTPLSRLDSTHRHHLIERYFPVASHQVILLSTDTEIGSAEFQNLDRQQAISHTYRLNYLSGENRTTIEPGYFDFPPAK
jgi:DNA sulfur modification protein DndD